MAKQIEITLVRHGRSRADDEGVHEGRYDSPLTEVGCDEAEKAGQELFNRGLRCSVVIASPLQRAQSTASILSKCLGAPMETDADWIEMDNGPLAGLTLEEAEARYPKPAFRSPYDKLAGSGESAWALYARAARAIEKLVQRGPGRYVVVAHGNVSEVPKMKLNALPVARGHRTKNRPQRRVQDTYRESTAG
jgi:2,3-bisphosphoglycerate-dependent phosphoglycerate mutase